MSALVNKHTVRTRIVERISSLAAAEQVQEVQRRWGGGGGGQAGLHVHLHYLLVSVIHKDEIKNAERVLLDGFHCNHSPLLGHTLRHNESIRKVLKL